MFEIRIICDPDDTDRIHRALTATFDTGPARQYPTRDSKRRRLYITADHRPNPKPFPTPDAAERAERDPRGYVREQYAQWAYCVCDDFGEGDCLLHPDPDH